MGWVLVSSVGAEGKGSWEGTGWGVEEGIGFSCLTEVGSRVSYCSVDGDGWEPSWGRIVEVGEIAGGGNCGDCGCGNGNQRMIERWGREELGEGCEVRWLGLRPSKEELLTGELETGGTEGTGLSKEEELGGGEENLLDGLIQVENWKGAELISDLKTSVLEEEMSVRWKREKCLHQKQHALNDMLSLIAVPCISILYYSNYNQEKYIVYFWAEAYLRIRSQPRITSFGIGSLT